MTEYGTVTKLAHTLEMFSTLSFRKERKKEESKENKFDRSRLPVD
jgi:hypothetical protein